MHRKTFKSKTGKTPYAQPLGHEVLLPAELVAPSIRRAKQHQLTQ